MTKLELKTLLQNYLDKFGDFCKERSINTEGIGVDHICYRCVSKEEFEEIRGVLEFEEAYIHQSIISKRRIAYVGFQEPLNSICGPVYYLELSDQKPDRSQVSSCDHIEPIPLNISFEEMKRRFTETGLPIEENNKPHHSTSDMYLPNGVTVKMSHEALVHTIIKSEFVLGKN